MLQKIENKKPRIKKFKVILLAVILVFVLSLLLSAVYLLRPIEESELKKIEVNKIESKGVEYIEYCYEPSASLKSRCDLFRGKINLVLVGTGGITDIYEIGCFPEGKTNDEGKFCESNTNCQGYCIENSFCSIEKSEKSCYYCSGYKKPFFIFKRVGGSTGLPLLCK